MTNTFIDALAQNPVLQDLEININTVGEASASPPAADVVETPEVKAPVIPDNIYLRFNEEEQITQAINENLNIFQINGLINTVKASVNPLHLALQKKSKVFIFGAGGTTSWFLPKLLKIYNDAFHKVPNLRYDLQIILIDLDQVRI